MIYIFNQYILDISRYELYHDGEPVSILPKTFDLLAYLVEHHGATISKETLHNYLWPDQFVSDSALTYHIAAARRAIGDSGQRQNLIKTVYGRGYQFIAPVEARDTDAIAAPAIEPAPAEPMAAADDTEVTIESPAAPPSPSSSVEPTDERRQLTALWCSLVAASTSGGAIDPEDQHEVLQHARSVCVEIMQQFGHCPAQQLSHGLLAYFGYPHACEDDAQRAVRTGLRLAQAVQRLSQDYTRTRALALIVRVALHSGVMVIPAATREPDAAPLIGEAPHMAAQLASLAGPNTVVLSAATLRLVEGYFACDNLGEFFIEELAQSMVVHTVVGESGAQSRIDAALATRLTPFVGRDYELDLLLARWEEAQAGRGQAVLLSGDAGIGKSRLVHTFYERLTPPSMARIEGHCLLTTQHHAFYPFVAHFQRLASFDHADSPADQWSKWMALSEQLGLSQEDMVLVATLLLSLKPPAPPPTPVLSPQQQQQKIHAALLTWLLHEAEQQPLRLVLEDLHWADASTLDFLSLLIEHAPAARLFILLTFRTTFTPPWESRSHVTLLTLSRMTQRQTDRIILEITGGKSLPVDIVEQLHAKTDGIPLFVEEMTRMVLESGLVKERDDAYELIDASAPLTVPSTLHDSLAARLDRLGIGKRTAQLASAIGREFSYDLIRAVADDDDDLQQKLARLVDAEILYQRGLFPRAVFVFKHALIQEAAYQSLLRGTRRRRHRRIAQVLEEQFPEIREAQPELLAHHYTEAGLHRAAVDYWQRAASQAFERGAFFDAEAHVQRGLSATAQLTDASERHQCELVLQLRLAVVLRFTITYGADAVTQSLRRAQTLCEKIGDDSQLFSVIRSLWFSYIAQCQLATTCELAQRLVDLASQQQQPVLMIEAHRNMGVSQLFLGEHATALHHFEFSKQVLTSRNDAQRHSDNPIQSPSALAMVDSQGAEEPVLLSYLAWNQWLRGYPSQALETMDNALRIMQKEDLTRSSIRYGYGIQYFTLLSSATLHHWRRELNDTALQVEATLVLANQYGAPLVKPRAIALQGWVLAQHGQHEEGIALTLGGIADYREQGAILSCTYMLAMLAECYGQIGDVDQGLAVVDEALDLAHAHDERWWEAELYRLQAELRLQLEEPDITQATADLHQALTIARRQEAKSLELRAATSLARLLLQQGASAEARDLLTPVYDWFTEGFDTLDLQEAKALLDALA